MIIYSYSVVRFSAAALLTMFLLCLINQPIYIRLFIILILFTWTTTISQVVSELTVTLSKTMAAL